MVSERRTSSLKSTEARPEPDDFRAELLDDFLGLDGVAERLVHGPALAIERPAVERAGSVRRAALEPDADQQRAVEPAAILVAAFQVHVGGPGQAEARR